GMQLAASCYTPHSYRPPQPPFLIPPRTLTIVSPQAPRQYPRAATVENRRTAPVIFFVHGIIRGGLDRDRVWNRINGYWKECVVVVMMPMVEKPRRVSGAGKQGINEAIRCGEKLTPLKPVRSQRCDAGRRSKSAAELPAEPK